MYKKPYTDGHIQFDVFLQPNNLNLIHLTTFNLYQTEKFSQDNKLPKMYLTKKQKTALFYYPDMLPVFAKKTKELILGGNKIPDTFDIVIQAKCEMGFMGRAPQAVIDSSVDLTRVSSSNTNSWLNQLKQSPWDLK